MLKRWTRASSGMSVCHYEEWGGGSSMVGPMLLLKCLGLRGGALAVMPGEQWEESRHCGFTTKECLNFFHRWLLSPDVPAMAQSHPTAPTTSSLIAVYTHEWQRGCHATAWSYSPCLTNMPEVDYPWSNEGESINRHWIQKEESFERGMCPFQEEKKR